MVEAAIKATKDALIIVARTQPQDIEAPTVAAAHAAAVRDIHSALVDHGIKAIASTGSDLGELGGRPLAKDLSPFEHLLGGLEIGGENTRGDIRKPSAFSAFVREALAAGKRE